MLITSYDHAKVSDYLIKESPRKVCLIFWHGAGDNLLFIQPLSKLRSLFPDIQIDIALQAGVGQEELFPDAVLITNPNEPIEGYDYTCQLHFPMSEHLNGAYTKQGWCCVQELGIDPVDDHATLAKQPSRLVAIHYQGTALPNAINPTEEVAEKIWNEVLDVGFIPIEAFFKHRYYNPVNAKFGFIDCTIRRAVPSLNTLIGLYQSCAASICGASGNLPLSLCVLPKRTLYLKKDFSIKCYTKELVPEIDVNNYVDGSVKTWLKGL